MSVDEKSVHVWECKVLAVASLFQWRGDGAMVRALNWDLETLARS